MAKPVLLIGVGVVALTIISVLLLAAQTSEVSGEVKCPFCGSKEVWTPIGTKSENFLWKCFNCGKTWSKTYSEKAYRDWLHRTPVIVRDMVLKFVAAKHPDAKQLLPPKPVWSVQQLSQDKVVYKCGGWIISVEKTEEGYKVTLDFSATRIPGYIGIPHRIVWTGIFTFDGKIVEESYGHYY